MRSFRTKIDTASTAAQWAEQLLAGITKRLKGTLQTGIRARHVALGQDAVADAMRKNQAVLVWLSDDVGESTCRKFEQNAARKEIDLLQFLSKKELGAWLGHDFVVILALTDPARAQAIVQDVSKLRQLSEV